MPSKPAAFISKDGKVAVYQISSLDVKSLLLPTVTEHIDEPIKMDTVDAIRYVKTNERTACPCCGTRLPTFREQ